MEGIILVNKLGTAIKSTFNQAETIEYGSLVNQFKEKALAAINYIYSDVRNPGSLILG